MSLRDAQNIVRAFNRKFQLPAPTSPVEESDVDWEAHVLRLKWLISECYELWNAIENHDMAGVADAYTDIEVFALGGHINLGVDGTPLFDAVMRANMTKVKVPGVAKIQKGPDFKHPDIGALIDEQRRGK